MYTQVSSRSDWPPIRTDEREITSCRRANVFRGSNRAHRRAASKSKPDTSEAEFQVGVDFASSTLECSSELVFQSHIRQSKGDKIGVRFDPCPSLRFLNERRANATGDTAALLLEKP